jgi:tRNA A-37 threonylcarbamoyl transferase component Bud32
MNGSSFSGSDGLADRVLRDLSQHEKTRTPSVSRFEVVSTLGQGATAIVYRARDRVLNRTVAVKALREGTGLSDIARERFRREARAAAGLAHPNVVTVFDAGEEDGKPFLVMELIEGRPFGELIREPNADRTTLLALLEKAARGVAAAHEKGIVHRDLKPANILVAAGGEPKVGDFGLAHVLDTKSELTRTGTALGTPLYMAPEQVEGRPDEITARTDVYALGAILYEILAGHTPHAGETLAELYRRIVRDDPAPPGGPRDAEVIAMKALEKEPARRYADAKEFADDLKRHLSGEPILARPVGAWGRWARRIRRNPLGYGLGAAAAAGLLAAILLSVQVARLSSALPDPRPWRPVFDGTSTACFMTGTPKGWRLEKRELVSGAEHPDSVQTSRLFEDGEVRVRFVCEKMNYLGFNIRLGTEAGYGVEWDRRGVESMGGAERSLIFTLRGDEVTAALDGAPLPIVVHTRNRRGTLHFGGVGGTLRIRSIDWREPRP